MDNLQSGQIVELTVVNGPVPVFASGLAALDLMIACHAPTRLAEGRNDARPKPSRPEL